MPLALFDDRVSNEMRRARVHTMKNNEWLPDPPVHLPMYAEKCPALQDIFTTNSLNFFVILDLHHNFLDIKPDYWSGDSDYQRAM